MKQIIYLKQEWVKAEEKDDKTVITPLSELTNKAFTIKSQHRHRTVAQNKSLHLYCKKVADALNDAGFSVNAVLNRKRYAKLEKAFKSAKKWVSASPKTTKAIERLEELVFEKEEVELTWTVQLVKDIIWRRIQIALYKDKTSSTQLKNDEVTRVYENMNVYLSTRVGIESIEFPSFDSLILEKIIKENQEKEV